MTMETGSCSIFLTAWSKNICIPHNPVHAGSRLNLTTAHTKVNYQTDTQSPQKNHLIYLPPLDFELTTGRTKPRKDDPTTMYGRWRDQVTQ